MYSLGRCPMYAGHYRLPYTRSQNPSVFLRNLLTRAEPWHIGVGDSVVGRLVRWVALQALSPFFWSSIRFRHEADPERIEDSPIAISRMVRLCFTYRILPGGYRGGGGRACSLRACRAGPAGAGRTPGPAQSGRGFFFGVRRARLAGRRSGKPPSFSLKTAKPSRTMASSCRSRWFSWTSARAESPYAGPPSRW